VAITFIGWTGDFAAQVPGREPMQALIALNVLGDGSLSSIFQYVKEQGDDQAVFKVNAAQEGVFLRSAGFEWPGPNLLAVAIEMLPGGVQLPAGANLVHIVARNELFEPDEARQWHTSTFATIVVPAKGADPKIAVKHTSAPAGATRRGT
jgi:hypothetical protein